LRESFLPFTEVRTMSATLTIRDETLSGESLREWALEVTSETMTVRELIRSRVYQEVQDYNLRSNSVFQGLVRPDEAEEALNGWKLKKARRLDWKLQFERAVEAFEKNQILILVNDRQAGSLDEEFTISSQTRVTFLRLTMLVGG
jgi:hypothetical protein